MTTMSNKPFTIGILAKAAEVNIETIRYYQRVGLIAEPVKPLQGYRIYPSATLNRIKFIKRAQQLGFSLAEISELLELGEGSCSDVRQRAEEKRAHIEQQIHDLNNLRNTLTELISSCQSNSDTHHCAIVETLTAV